MRKLAIAFLTLVLFAFGSAQTNLSGTIIKDSTLTLARSPYIVSGFLAVNSPFTLRVDSGVVVRFLTNAGLDIKGTLRARQARFTSNKDTTGGLPAKNDWNYIQANGGTIVLDTCVVRYGGNGQTMVHSVNSGSITLNSCTISNALQNGVTMQNGGQLRLSNTSILNCDWPLTLWSEGAPVFDGLTNNLTGNAHNGVYIAHSTQNGTVVFDTCGVPYFFGSTYNVNSAASLTVCAGNTLKFANGVQLSIYGKFRAIGSASQKINFTAYTNDNLPAPGFDTNGDGSASAPSASYWYGVYFYESSVDTACVMRQCSLSYAGYGSGGAVTMTDANPTVDSCSFATNYYGVKMQNTSSPVFTNNTIGSSTVVPIAMSFAANPVFTNNTFSYSDNQYDAIGLLAGANGQLAGDAVLPIRSVTNIPNVTYLMLESMTIPEGRTLTISKGIVVKSMNNYRITVKGKLVANATPDSMITFTSVKDDNFGNPGDTNKDGSASVPALGEWDGFVFEPTSDTASVLNYCRIKYASLSSAYYVNRYIGQGAVSLVSASPTVSNCEIREANYGIYAFLSSKPKIWNDQFINIQYTPLALSIPADPSIIGNSMTNVKWRGIGIIGGALGTSGTLKQRTFAGVANMTYVLLEDLTVATGTDIVIQPGIVVKMNNGTGFFIDGSLRAKGTLAEGKVIFTSIKDDNFGNSGQPLPGDLNGDGNATSPARGDWTTIWFRATSDDAKSLLDSCLIKFGANYGPPYGAVTTTDASPTISNTAVSDGYGYGFRFEGASTPVLNNVSISAFGRDPFAISLKANPSLSGITFSGNGSNGILIIEGTLSSDATLFKRDVAGISNIAYIMGQVTVASNAVLTIEAGAVIKFIDGYSRIVVNGALRAIGTKTQKIIFTSLSDDSKGGDTNADGNGSVPGKGNWHDILFQASGIDSLNLVRNCELRYGGSGAYDYNYTGGAIRFSNAKAVVDSCVINQSATPAFGVFGSATPVVSNCELNNIDDAPVTMSMFSNPTFTNIAAYNMKYTALGIVPETYSISAAVPVRNFAGYSNITYLLYGTCTVNNGTVITVPAGIVFKNGNFVVNGALRFEGTKASKIVFTDTRDDEFGNPKDTNNDGLGSAPSISYNDQRVLFTDVSLDSLSLIRYAILRYAGSGIRCDQASPTITNTLLEKCNYGATLTQVSAPHIDSCMFRNMTYNPLYLSLVSYPASTVNDSISGTTYRSLGVLNNESLVQDVTLLKRNFAGITNIPYNFGNYTIASNSVLTIQPGVVLKFNPGTGMTVRKGLIAEGGATADSSIIFTDIRDDFYGGDSNSDSTASSPADYFPGWSGITFQDESLDPLCRLKNSVVRYVTGYNYSAITANNASPSIISCTITDNIYGVTANGASNPVINYCDIYRNSNLGINNVNKSFVINAENNWWGSNNGPTHASNPGGTGQSVSDAVDFNPWLGAGASNPIAGDVSLNGLIQAYDASLLLKWIVDPSGSPLSSLQQKVADVSGTAGITSYDASLILQYVVGALRQFPIELKTSSKADMPVALAKTAQYEMFSASSPAAERGGTVTMTIEGKGMSGIYSADIELTYNPAQLSFVSAKCVDKAETAMLAEASSDGKVRLVLANAQPMAGDGALVELTFKAAKDVRGMVKSDIGFTKFTLNESADNAAVRQSAVSIKGKPTSFDLSQNYPNPFNPTTTIAYQVPEDNSAVSIEIYSITGQHVRTLVNEAMPAGEYRVVWNGRDDNGSILGSGLYFFRMRSGSYTGVKKMMFIK